MDVVIVSYNSGHVLRACVEPLASLEGVKVVIVDNASSEGGLDAVEGLPVELIRLSRNGGFAHGCNAGWRAGDAPYVLFLNPDARIDEASLERLAAVLDQTPNASAVGPRIGRSDGMLDFSQRRFPRLRSTYAQALFLHRIFPRASWSDEVIRDERAYERRGTPDWLSGACILVRRPALEKLGGWDDGFFMYSEDIDLCRRIRDIGDVIVFEPDARAVHEGGASAPRSSLLPILAESRLRYAVKHRSSAAALLERAGVGLGALSHLVVSRGGSAARRGHLSALGVALKPLPPKPSRPVRGREARL